MNKPSCIVLALLVAVALVAGTLGAGAPLADDALAKPQDPAGATATAESEAPSRASVKQTPGFRNLQELGLAMHNYHDVFGHFPSAVVLNEAGNVGHSWRVELLPVLRRYVNGVRQSPFREIRNFPIERGVYDKLIAERGYDVNQPWDSPANKALLEQDMPEEYRHPLDAGHLPQAGFYAVVGTGTAFDPANNSTYTDIKGWPASTLMLVEARAREPWTKPVDVTYSSSGTVPLFGGFNRSGHLAMTCDGAVHFIDATTPADDLRALITKDQTDSFNIAGIPYKY